MKKPRLILSVIGLAATSIVFQNCYRISSPSDQSNEKSFIVKGGEGYGGKVYVNRGDCGQNEIGVKSVVREKEDGDYELVRENCVDLNPPRPVDKESLRFSNHDRSVFVMMEEVYDRLEEASSENKLTTAFCYAPFSSMEVTVWYNSETLNAHPDPRLADELYGQVRLDSARATGALRVSRPEIFADRLVYASTAGPGPFELIQTRDGKDSTIRFEYEGTMQEATVTCHAQAAPKFLESDDGYVLRLRNPGHDGSRFALLAHWVQDGMDSFKVLDGSEPITAFNSKAGWDAGYLMVGPKAYEMRKTEENKLCLAPADKPDSDCEMDVLGKVNSEEFGNLFQVQKAMAKRLITMLADYTPKLKLRQPLPGAENAFKSHYNACGSGAAFPSHLNWRRLASVLYPAAKLLVYVNDWATHRELRASVMSAARALMADLPNDLFVTPSCRPDLLTARLVLDALSSVLVSTNDIDVRIFVRRRNAQVTREIRRAVEPSFADAGHLMAMALNIEKTGVSVFDVPFALDFLHKVLGAQIRRTVQRNCDGVSLFFGGWSAVKSKKCGQGSLRDEPLIFSMMEFHRYLDRKGLCDSVVLNNSASACRAIRNSVAAYLVFRWDFGRRAGTVEDFDAAQAASELRRIRNLPSYFAFLYGMGWNDDQAVQRGFTAGTTIKIGQLRASLLPKNFQLAAGSGLLLADGMLVDSRIAELLIEEE